MPIITLPPVFYENPDPYYRSFLPEIEGCLNHFKGDKLLALFRSFIHCNMLTKEYPNTMFYRLLEDKGLIWEAIALFEIPSVYQLYYPQDNLGLFSHFGYGFFLQRKLIFNKRKNVINKWKEANEDDISLVKDVQILMDNVTYPNPDLKKIWQCYEQNACSLPSKKLFESYTKALELYQKLTSFEGTNDAWLELVLTADDADFAMLHTYSKYCRLFRDDEKMKENYCNAVKEHCQNCTFSVPWDNPFSFEISDEHFFTTINNHDILQTTTTTEHQPLSVHFTSENAISQNFPFKDSMIYYILKNASAAVQLKLSFTSKYMFLRNPTLICHTLKITDGNDQIEAEYYQQSVHFKVSEMDQLNFYNVYLSIVLYCDGMDRKCLSKLIPKMFECNAKYITIIDQDISFNEFIFLVGHGNVLELTLVDVRIVDDGGKLISLADIIALMPSIERISGDNIPTNKETLTKLLKIPFTSKFDKILLRSVNVSHFNPEQVIEFLKKNVAADCDVGINFLQNGENEEGIDEFAHTVYFGIWGFWTGSERPSFRLLP
uniref:Uncharacterized protein n=1 Tax=Panagrolaimus davidi TaxID=227884 RepID=A0A914PCI4_9BILA